MTNKSCNKKAEWLMIMGLQESSRIINPDNMLMNNRTFCIIAYKFGRTLTRVSNNIQMWSLNEK